MDPSEVEELSRQADEERKAIVAKYDMGRVEGAVIEDWEDPKLELYHTQDRYGFIHDRRLPDAKDRTEREKKQINLERSREIKWAEMIKNGAAISKYFGLKAKYREKMINRVHKGVPDAIRGQLWYILLDLNVIKEEQEGKYKEMRRLARQYSPHIRQIDLDVNRTYRDHIMFRERYNKRQGALFHVLAAYSVYNSEVGYCQGMSQIVAVLLMYLNEEEDAFWALSQLMANPKYAMHGFFIPGFPKLVRFQAHHDKVLKKFLPKLKKHLDKNGIDTGIYTLKWFFQCFLDRVPFSLALRVWDLWILEGERILTAMAYNILRMHRRYLKTLDMDRLIEHLQISLGKHFGYEDDAVIERLREAMYELRSSRLDWPGRPPTEELPQKPFGLAPAIKKIEPQDLGIRTDFSAKEREFSHRNLRKTTESDQEGEDDGGDEEDDDDDDVEFISPNNGKFRPAGTSSPRTKSRDFKPVSVKEAEDRLDDSVRLMLEAADLNGKAGSESVMNVSVNSIRSRGMETSFESTGALSHASSDVVRIRVPYNEEDAKKAAAANSFLSNSRSASREDRYEGNKIRITVKNSIGSPEREKADLHNLSSPGLILQSSMSEKKKASKSKKKDRSSYHGSGGAGGGSLGGSGGGNGEKNHLGIIESGI